VAQGVGPEFKSQYRGPEKEFSRVSKSINKHPEVLQAIDCHLPLLSPHMMEMGALEGIPPPLNLGGLSPVNAGEAGFGPHLPPSQLGALSQRGCGTQGAPPPWPPTQAGSRDPSPSSRPSPGPDGKQK
jgi:hypothetical protein